MYPNGNEFMSALSMFIYKAIVSNRKRILQVPTNLRNPSILVAHPESPCQAPVVSPLSLQVSLAWVVSI